MGIGLHQEEAYTGPGSIRRPTQDRASSGGLHRTGPHQEAYTGPGFGLHQEAYTGLGFGLHQEEAYTGHSSRTGMATTAASVRLEGLHHPDGGQVGQCGIPILH